VSVRRTSPEGELAFLAAAGAAETAHPSGTLMAHLRGTRDLLARWGCASPLCAAGLYHSVYGTEAFRTATVAPDERERIREQIGAEAEHLVHLYGVIVRRSLYANLARQAPYHAVDRVTGERIALDVGELRDLVTLDLANRLEQLPRIDMSLWRIEADRRLYATAAHLLPAAAVADMQRIYPRRSPLVVVADGLFRLARRLFGRGTARLARA